MKRKNLFKLSLAVLTLACLLTLPVSEMLAAPVLQVWSPDWDFVGDNGPDEDTWFVLGNSADIQVLGEFKKDDTTITDLFLIISAMPDGLESGMVSLFEADGITPIASVSGSFFDTKTNINDSGLLPYDVDLNDHYPFKDDVSDFWVFALDDMVNPGELPGDLIHDYNAETGVIGDDNSSRGGDILEYYVEFANYTGIHIDVVALVDYKKVKMNPLSHDLSVPEPATIFLLGSGLLGLGLLGRRRGIKS